MSFIALENLPFRRVFISGVWQYICDLGDVRLFVPNTALLKTGLVYRSDSITGAVLSYDYSIPLPALITLNEVPGNSKYFTVEQSPTSVVMAGQQFSGLSNSVGVITSLTKTPIAISGRTIKFSFPERLLNVISIPSIVEGIITIDNFAGRVPDAFSDTGTATITNQYGVTLKENFTLNYGASSGYVSPYDSFVAGSSAEMLSLSVKKADRCFRSDTGASYINITGLNEFETDWQLIAGGTGDGISVTDVESIVAAHVSTFEAHATIISGNPHSVTKGEVGLGNVPNTDFTAAVSANTAKIGITTDQVAAIESNTTNIALAQQQLSDFSSTVNDHSDIISGNPHHVTKADVGLGSVPNTDFTDSITSLTEHTTTLTGNPHNVTKEDIGLGSVPNINLLAEVSANTAKVGITEEQTSAIAINTAKVGISTQQEADLNEAHDHAALVLGNPHQVTKAEVGLGNVPNIDFTNSVAAATSHLSTTTGNPHSVTKVEVGLGNVPNIDFTSAVAANTAKVGISIQQSADLAAANTHRLKISGNPHAVTKADVGLGVVPNRDFTNNVAAADSHIITISGNPHHVTKADVGLADVPNIDNTQIINELQLHAAAVSGNPHHITKADIGLSNVPNLDFSNASNITGGMLPISVIPPTRISETFVVASEIDQLALTALKGDIVVRTDLPATFINTTNANLSMMDWQLLAVSNGAITTVNGQTGTVILTTSDITEGSNLYYSEDRVHNHPDVSAVLALAHSHANRATLDMITGSFLTQQAAAIAVNTAKVGITEEQANGIIAADNHIVTTGNPHGVTKTEVGLGNVPDHDFTIEVAANTAKIGITDQQTTDIITANTHITTVSGNPHAVTKADVGLGSVPNIDLTSAVTANTTHRGLVEGNPHQVTKAEIGLGNVPNTDFTAAAINSSTHIAIVTGNPHQVTKVDIGLGNVPDVDLTAAVAANTAKVGITAQQGLAILENTAKVGITTQQADDILNNNAHRSVTTGNPHHVTKEDVGLSDVPNTNFTMAVAANTAKVGITAQQITDITAANAHLLKISGNPHKVTKSDVGLSLVPNTNFTSAVASNTTHRSVITGNPHQVTKVDIGLGNVQNTDLTANVNSAISHTELIVGNPHHVTKVDVGLGNVPNTDFTTAIAEISSGLSDHSSIVSGNPHSVTKAEVGLSNVPNIDFTTAIAANTAKVGITTDQIATITSNANHSSMIVGNPHHVTKADVGLGNVSNVDFTSEIAANTAKVGITAHQIAVVDQAADHIAIVADNPHNVTKADVGLSLVPNYDFTNEVNINNSKVGISIEQASDITSNNAHRLTVTGNPHAVTKADLGLGNVPNVDTTNASNITTGTLPSSVLPPIGITDVYPVDSEAAQLALTVQKGDIAIRVDINRSFINTTGSNTSISDWQELSTPTDSVLSVNNQTGTVVLTTDNITEGSNLYFTNARVSDNPDVAANTVSRHAHPNKTILDAIEVALTTSLAASIASNTAKVGITPQQATAITTATSHIGQTSGNPHAVTKTEVGLGNVPNTDFTAEVSANTTHANRITGNPHAVTKADVGLGSVPNHDFTAEVTANTAKIGISTNQVTAIAAGTAHIATISGNPHHVTKAEVGLSNVPNIDLTAAVAANTAKVGITAQQSDDLTNSVTHYNRVTGNPHAVTKFDIGLGNVPNTNFSAAIAANTAKIGISTQQIDDLEEANAHRTTITGNPHSVTKAEVGLGNVPNTDFTIAVTSTTLHLTDTSNPHHVTKADVSLGNVPNIDFTNDVTSANSHRLTIVGNPHHVSKTDVGLGNVPNTDFTTKVNNATTHIAAVSGNPHHVTKSDVGLGNVPNTDFTVAVAANTAKVGITTAQAAAIINNTAKVGISAQQTSEISESTLHVSKVSGNPHHVTKAEVGLGNVPNTDFTNRVTTLENASFITGDAVADLIATSIVNYDHANTKSLVEVRWTAMDYSNIRPLYTKTFIRFTTYWCNLNAFHTYLPKEALSATITSDDDEVTITPNSQPLTFRVDIGSIDLMGSTSKVITLHIVITDSEPGSVPLALDYDITVVDDEFAMGTAGLGYSDRFITASFDNESGLIFVGDTDSVGSGSNDALVMRFANNFESDKSVVFGGYDDDYFKDITVLTDGTIVCCGYESSVGYGNEDGLIAKFGTSLNLVAKGIYGAYKYDYFYGIAADASDNIFCAGYSSSYNKNNKYFATISKYDKNLNLIKGRTFGTYGSVNQFYAVAIQDDGSVICVGKTDTGGYCYAPLIVKFDNNLNYVSSKRLYSGYDGAFNSITIRHGKVYCVGNNSDSGIIIIFDANLNILTKRSFKYLNGTELNDVTVTSTGFILGVGSCYSNSALHLGLMVLLDPDGNLFRAATVGGTNHDVLTGSNIDRLDNVIIVGYSGSEGQGSTDGIFIRGNARKSLPIGTHIGVSLPKLVYAEIVPSMPSYTTNATAYTDAIDDLYYSYSVSNLTLVEALVTSVIDRIQL